MTMWRDFGPLRVLLYLSTRPRLLWWREAPKWELRLGPLELRWRVHDNKGTMQ